MNTFDMKVVPNQTFAENLQSLGRYCAYQERCKKDVRQKMYELGILPPQQELLMQQLEKEGFVDEARYAKIYVRGKFQIHQWGRFKIKAGLYEKGIPTALITQALAEIDEAAYREVVQTLAEKQLPKIKAKNDYEKKQKLFFFLSQRGFENDLISGLDLTY